MQRFSIKIKNVKLIKLQQPKYHNLSNYRAFNKPLSITHKIHQLQLNQRTLLHLSACLCKEPDSKVDKAVDILKDLSKQNEEEKSQLNNVEAKSTQVSSIVPRPNLWQRIVHELKHYYNGFKLLYLETKIMFRILGQVLNGHQLTRRERKQLTQTAADLFRLVPFSLFVIVPFLEFTLPLFLKFFPNMLPSTFKEESKEQEKIKIKLKAKLEMAKFLQDTLEETALTGSEDQPKENTLNYKFAEFMRKIRSKGVQPSTEEILKYSALFENELTLDNLTRQQLIALCQILEVNTYGNIPTNDMLIFQLRMKLRELEADDKVILKEGGVASLDTNELQQACRDRGMRALGVSEARLRAQLEQWLDLHITQKVPASLLILSRALYLPENLPADELIKSTISALPNSIENATLLKIAEASGNKVDNQMKLEMLKQQEEAIRIEREELTKTKAAAAVAEPVVLKTPQESKELLQQNVNEQLVDKAEVLTDKAKKIEINESQELLTPQEMKSLGQIIENIVVSTDKQVKEDIDELKKDVTDYKQDLQEVEKIAQTEKLTKLTETKSAKILSKRVDKLVKDLDKLALQLQVEEQNSNKNVDVAAQQKQTSRNTVSIDEIIATIRRIQGVSDDVKEKKIAKVLESLDKDHDGKIDDLSDVVKVFELIADENVKVTKNQLGKILEMIEKEKIVEMEEQQKEAQDNKQETIQPK